ncbi:EAL domain-containing protein [Aromatoleum toluclasticum]|uniref:EAL domain-containing protein n=1 Tax=Aromatoleum toluclasticum TaxID=92003 RepID=UPI000370499B|nr:EAL domain-containing protein [Aromatoleum toluclasticum]
MASKLPGRGGSLPGTLAQLSLGARLRIGFALLVAITLAVGIASLASHRRIGTLFEEHFAVELRIAELSLLANHALLRARRYEKDFLLAVPVLGYEESRSRYVTLVRTNLETLREHVAAIGALAREADVRNEVRQIEAAAIGFEKEFLAAAALQGQLGRRDDGLAGTLRAAAHRIEALIPAGAHRLRADLFAMRRFEKDYMITDSALHARRFADAGERFAVAVAGESLPAALRSAFAVALHDYREAFLAYVAVRDELETTREKYLEAVHEIESQLQRLHAHASGRATSTREELLGFEHFAGTALLMIAALAAALGLAIGYFFSRSIRRSIGQTMTFAQRLAAGDLGVRLRSDGGDEFATLNVALNDMAGALQAAQRREAQRSTELASSNAALLREVDERSQAERTLRASEERFRSILESAADGIVITDAAGRITMVNARTEMLFGYPRSDLLGQTVEVLVPERFRAQHSDQRSDYHRTPHSDVIGMRRPGIFARRRDGSEFPADISRAVMAHDGATQVIAAVRDISAQVRAENELRRLNRTLRMLTLCNETLVRAQDEGELLETVCGHIVEHGGYRLAWVGLALDDPARSVHPAAAAGVGADYLRTLDVSWADVPSGQGPTGRAIRLGTTQTCIDIPGDPAYAPWRAEALRRGFTSSIALPLTAAGRTVGALNIYASERDAFDLQEVALLEELANDLAYGLRSLRERDARQRAERELAHQAHYDTLTGLANRHLFRDRLDQALVHARRNGRAVAVVLLDLDRFKAINDTLGQARGDTLLKETARRVQGPLRNGDTVARLVSDEFAILLDDLAAVADVAPLVGRLLEDVAAPLDIAGHGVYSTASLGISLFPRDGQDAEALLGFADIAMHNAKTAGGNAFRFYSPEMNQRVTAQLALASALRSAIDKGEMRVFYQPKVSLGDGRVTSAEALVRWQHPERGMVSPADFIPVAEDTGLIVPLGEWVLRETCRQQAAWIAEGLAVPPVAVNLSARQFRQENLPQTVHAALAAAGLDPHCLQLEITESTVMHDVDRAIAMLRELNTIGICIALDDFGTGYSSLAYLKRFPIDQLKIDRAFVRDIASDPEDAAICRAVIGLAHSLDLTVVAEGVETRPQLDFLRANACDEMQGFLFSRPVPAAEYAALLAAGRALSFDGD